MRVSVRVQPPRTRPISQTRIGRSETANITLNCERRVGKVRFGSTPPNWDRKLGYHGRYSSPAPIPMAIAVTTTRRRLDAAVSARLFHHSTPNRTTR